MLGIVVEPLFTLPTIVVGLAVALLLRYTDKSR